MSSERIRELLKNEADCISKQGHKGGHALWEFANTATPEDLVRFRNLILSTKA